jgi:uncharacterized membrane protein YdbT with pleckstrin-like domain
LLGGMPYVTSVLQPGETIKAIGRLHWVIFVRALLLLAFGAVLLVAAGGEIAGRSQLAALVLGAVLLVLGVLSFAHAWYERRITELAVTNHRVIYKRGFIRRHTVEMNMDKVETVNVDQSLLGRLLGFGTIRVLGTGQGIERLGRIASPIQLRNAITAR